MGLFSAATAQIRSHGEKTYETLNCSGGPDFQKLCLFPGENLRGHLNVWLKKNFQCLISATFFIAPLTAVLS